LVGKVAPKTTIAANESEYKLRFGGGLNTRASSDEIDPRECADGQNFDLDLGNTQFRPRKPFDLMGTAPNAGRINGFAQLVTTGGVISTLIQAADTVYKVTPDWDTWTNVGTVSTSARIRGPRTHIWNLDDVVLISDLAGVEPVMQWDGTTLSDVYHMLGGDFIAKYIHIENERAFFANVISNSVSTPHVVVASARGDYETLSTQNRPSSSLSDADPFFIPMPDLKPINGMVGAYGLLVFSTLRGQMHKLTGTTPTDFEIESLFFDSYADGTEAMVVTGNDIIYGRPGRIESLISTDEFGDVDTNDLSIKVSNAVETFEGWRMMYSSRHQRIYCQPQDESELWVYHKPLSETGLSPWTKWVTRHALGFNPTTQWTMLDVENGLEYPYMGDASGNVYRLEGSGTMDGGTADIKTTRTSKLESGPGHAQIYDAQGAVKFRPATGAASTLTMSFLWQGASVFDSTITVELAAAEAGSVFSGDYFYGDTDVVYGSHFEGRLARERFAVPGQGNEVQIYTEIDGDERFQVNEVYFGFRAAG
jgi:hypothetical protein